MSRKDYLKILLVIGIFATVNLFPLNLIEGGTPDFSLSLYPNHPYNRTYLTGDTTLTMLVQNNGTAGGKIKYRITEKSENLFVNGRDGEKVPIREGIRVEKNENYWRSFALLPLSINQDNFRLELTLTDAENNVLAIQDFVLELLRPNMSGERISSIAREQGLKENVSTFLIPRYRRYWHVDKDVSGKADLGYVWLAVEENHNVLINDENGEVISENLELPWNVTAPVRGKTRVWAGSNFENKNIPAIGVEGDTSYNKERFELYFAESENDPTWISRRIFYWTSENLVEGMNEEVPDTERLELWVPAENGKKMFTISDFHHCAFRYPYVDSYTITEDVHSPISSDIGLQMWFSAVANYKDVYPNAEATYDRLGTTKFEHPIARSIFEENRTLFYRNLIGAGLVFAIFLVMFLFNKWKSGEPQS
ncbi:hypothetical protein AKJ64_04490 [candidate division MSBL1 archaeon SCGC-AAA259E17]|uniref:Uncharacterized protein n=1 Tax=candidate division MSBL1 archaeon SCGC-AAA259E17 TaxID=1698263 RepID=A0A133UC77_9EURY|nr:hypothetical protein AKJ64_04490 [candidate division MSBL1 archaeon SCGC-AAA259E17]